MTRKDYINIAAAILACRVRIENSFKEQLSKPMKHDTRKLLDHMKANQLRGVRRAAAHIADFLKDDNPANFDPELFLKNCGYDLSTIAEHNADSGYRTPDALHRHRTGEMLDN